MDREEKVLANKRKRNMDLYSIHRMLTADLLFYYAIKFIFLTQVKGLTASDIVLASAFFGLFKVVFQIPTIVLIEKVGSKKSLIISDLMMAVSVVVVMLSFNFTMLIIANLLSGVATGIREIAENAMLNKSIPNVEDKSSIFARVDSKGLSNFYLISAISAVLSGFLFELNGYIPMIICTIILLIATRVATLFEELETKKEYIQGIIDKEEELFQKTLVSGEKKLNEMLEKTENKTLSGTDAFKLYDTYGFPYELTEEYLKEKGYTVDKYEFDTCMNNQKEMARKSRKKEASMNIQNEALLNFKEESKFTGYEDYQTDTEVIALIKDGKLVDELTDTGYVILKETPFYAEMGGQVSDTGYIYNDSLKVLVEDLFISPNKEHVHIVNVEEGVIHVHDKVTARINVKRRNAIEKNHSATHLLHQALKEALDYEVLQAGSKVTEKELRFDFTYPKKITDEDICIIENLVNEKIQTKVDAKTDIMSLDEAVKSGAVHQFDEKYDKLVRVVTLYNSVELCGGTHVKNLGDINKFAIYNIESKGADVYRIEATTDTNIERVLFNAIKPYNDEMVKLLNKAKNIMDDAKEKNIQIDFNVDIDNSAPLSYKDIIFNRNEVKTVREKVKEFEKEYNLKKEEKLTKNNTEFDTIKIINNKSTIIKKVNNYEISILKTLIDNAFTKISKGIIFVANIKGNNVNFICKSNCDINAGDLVKYASLKSNGNGGGSNSYAQGGGTDITYIDEILKDIETKL